MRLDLNYQIHHRNPVLKILSLIKFEYEFLEIIMLNSFFGFKWVNLSPDSIFFCLKRINVTLFETC